jgi:hypothetical protein
MGQIAGSFYEKMENWGAGQRRRLFDHSLFMKGRKLQGVRLYRQMDKWGNAKEEVISTDEINAVVSFPGGEMPMMRLRGGKGQTESAGETGTFFYDILPIEIFFPWETKMEEGDIVFFTVGDEMGNQLPLMFRILVSVGSITTQVVWRKWNAAPLTSLDEVPEQFRGWVEKNITVRDIQ